MVLMENQTKIVSKVIKFMLIKEFDSGDLDYQYHIKIFRVNYEILDKTNENEN